MKVIWTRQARRRLGEIRDYIAADAPERASAFCERLVSASEQLAVHPYSGRLLPEDAAYRQLVVEGYRLVYRVADKAIYVLTIVSPGMLPRTAEKPR